MQRYERVLTVPCRGSYSGIHLSRDTLNTPAEFLLVADAGKDHVVMSKTELASLANGILAFLRHEEEKTRRAASFRQQGTTPQVPDNGGDSGNNPGGVPSDGPADTGEHPRAGAPEAPEEVQARSKAEEVARELHQLFVANGCYKV